MKQINQIHFTQTHKMIILIIISLGISFIFFGQNLRAEMGIIDDHSYISRDVLENPINVYKNFITAPEITQFGQNNRFRIMYWLMNDIETAIFGMDVAYCYLINICVFAFFVFTVFYVVWKGLGAWWATIFTLFVLTQSYFAHIFTRLGTAEVWTILGSSIYVLGYASIFRKIKQKDKMKSNWLKWIFMIIGLTITVGSKENFSIMIVAVISLLILLRYYKKITKSAIIASGIMIIVNIYQIAYIFTMQNNRGVDLYQNDLGIKYRFLQLLQSSFNGNILFFTVSALFFFSCLIGFLFYFYRTNKWNNEIDKKEIYDKLFFVPMIFFITLSFIFVFNLYVYDGKLYLIHRYAFPSILLMQILILMIIKWFFDVKEYFFKDYRIRFKKMLYIFLLIVLFIPFIKNIKYSKNMSNKNVQATILFQKELSKIIKKIKIAKKQKIVFVSNQLSDYEPLISVAKYLRYNGVDNDFMVKVNYELPEDDDSVMHKWIVEESLKFEQNGGDNFLPYNINNGEACFKISFNKGKIEDRCIDLGMIWQLGEYPY